MIIWTGWGILAILIPAFIFVSIQSITNGIFSDPTYYTVMLWPKLLATFASAAAVWFVGKKLNGKKGRVVIDKQTGKEFHLKRSHTFFFLKMEYWAIIIVVLGFIASFAR